MSQEEVEEMSVSEEEEEGEEEEKPYLITKTDFKQLASRYHFSTISDGCHRDFNRMLLASMDRQVAASMLRADGEHLKGLNQQHAEHGIKMTREYPSVFHK